MDEEIKELTTMIKKLEDDLSDLLDDIYGKPTPSEEKYICPIPGHVLKYIKKHCGNIDFMAMS